MGKLSDGDLLAYVNQHVSPTGENQERIALHRLWMDAIAFYVGLQWIVRDPTRGVRAPRNVPSHRVQFVANQILVNVMRNLSRMLAVNGQYEVIPNSTDLEDLLGAEVGRRYFEARRAESRFQDVLSDTMLWAITTGLAFMKVTWDPKSGPRNRTYLRNKFELLTGGPVATVDLTPEQEREKDEKGEFADVALGDVKLEAVSPFAVGWDWRAREHIGRKAQFMWQETLISRTEAIRRFPKHQAELEKTVSYVAGRGSIYYQELVAQLSGGREGLRDAVVRPEAEMNNLVRCIEWWERASHENDSRGRRAVICGNVAVVPDGPNPYIDALGGSDLELPFVDFTWFPVPGRAAGIGLVELEMDVQKGLNKTISRVLEAIEIHGNPRVFAATNSGVKKSHLTNEPNNLVYYHQPGGAPITVPPVQLPDYFFAQQDRFVQLGDSLAAQSDITQGGGAGQVRGTGGVQLLMERNDLILSVVTKRMMSAIRDVGEMELRLVGKFGDQERMLKIVGRNRANRIEFFTGADFKSNYDLRIVADPMQSASSTARMAEVERLVELGILNPLDPNDKQAILGAMQFRHPDVALEDLQDEEIDERIVMARMIKETGLIVPPNGWDTAGVRLREINRVRRNRVQWEALAEETRQRIMQRAEFYEQAVAQQAALQLQLAQMQGGGGGKEPGKASPPRAAKKEAV